MKKILITPIASAVVVALCCALHTGAKALSEENERPRETVDGSVASSDDSEKDEYGADDFERDFETIRRRAAVVPSSDAEEKAETEAPATEIASEEDGKGKKEEEGKEGEESKESKEGAKDKEEKKDKENKEGTKGKEDKEGEKSKADKEGKKGEKGKEDAAPAEVADETSDSDKDDEWSAEHEAGTRKTLTLNGVECAFRYCPAGSFTMGEGSTAHKVTLTKGFWLLETEVTQATWEATVGLNPSYFSKLGGGASAVDGLDAPNFPVERVSWEDCQGFVEKLNSNGLAPKGFKFRLPTEAEWEYACRAGTTTPFFWGTTLNGDKANCDGNYPAGTSTQGKSLKRTTRVGDYDANPWGLLDMHGNVYEWCADWFDAYGSTAQTDPTGPKKGEARVLRGGGWDFGANRCRSVDRHFNLPTSRFDSYGFRLALAREDSIAAIDARRLAEALAERKSQETTIDAKRLAEALAERKEREAREEAKAPEGVVELAPMADAVPAEVADETDDSDEEDEEDEETDDSDDEARRAEYKAQILKMSTNDGSERRFRSRPAGERLR